jgi:hypothetical protein
MHAISDAVAAGGVSVTELGRRAEQINEITNIINEIAQQMRRPALSDRYNGMGSRIDCPFLDPA